MASKSMADYLKTAGSVVIIGWLLSPIISLFVNKLFAYLFSDVSRKFRNLETIIVPDLKQGMSNVLEQRMRRSVEGKGSRDDLKTLAKIEEDLKSAFYEAQDIMDIVDYHRAEEEAVGHASSWVQRLDAAGTCIALCFRRSWVWLRSWIDVTQARAAVLRLYQLGRFPIQDLVCKMDSAIQTARAMLRQCAQCLCHQHLLPVSLLTPDSGSGGSMVSPGTSSSTSPNTYQVMVDAERRLGGPEPTLQRPAEKAVGDEEEKVEKEAEVKQEEDEKVEEEIEEEAENGALYRCVRQSFQSMLICLTNAIAFARSYRDWSYEVVGIESNKRDGIAVYYFFPPFGTNSLSKRIERVENILDDSKKSNLLNQQSSPSEIPNKDTNNERSSSEVTAKHTKKESSSRQEQIDDWYRKIERKVFGRDKDLDRICKMFRRRPDPYGTANCSSSKPYSVFGIHGIAGSGKSTLANYICDHERKAEDKHFDPVMFCHVSVTFRVEKIFRDMLREITKGITNMRSDNKDIESLGKELMEKLKGRRFLLVLDDLWVKGENQKEREILLHALSAGENGSIILVTAQTEDAASALGAQEKIPIQDLEEVEYLKLFMHHALQGAVDDDGGFEKIGGRIAKKLHRSPIAAVAVARRLQAEKSISFWKITENLDELNETMGALWWSYQQLGVDTRRCFQYCSTFPRGHILRRDELVHIWIALGFVNTMSNATEELEDVGMRYFQELLKFSFLQVKYCNSGECTIHDLLHELAERVAGSDSFRIDGLNVSPAKHIPSAVSHLFIGSKNAAQGVQTVEKNLELGNLRTLIIHDPYTDTPDRKERRHDLEKFIERLFMWLRKLWVLIIRHHSNPGELSFLASIGQMKHLRYFSIVCPNDYRAKLILPSTFSNLYQMQTIFVYPCPFMSYPDGMANLICLRHIRGWLVFPNAGRMTSLQTMHYFHVKKKQGYELKQLKHLNAIRGRLLIKGLENVGSKEEALEADLASKKRVTDLSLCFDGGDPDMEAEVFEGLCPHKDLQVLSIRGYKGSRYPSWMLSGQHHPDAPKHLRRLALLKCSCPLASFPEDSELFMNLLKLTISFGKWDSLPDNMECLVSLQRLNIFGYGQDKMVQVPTLPRSLQYIFISGWNFVLENMEHLVSLKSLSICRCDKMEVLPTLPQSLQKITIDCDVLSRTCQEEGQEEGHENWQKILAGGVLSP